MTRIIRFSPHALLEVWLILVILMTLPALLPYYAFLEIYKPRHDKTNKVSVRPAKTQISLGIRSVWSESSLSPWRNTGSLATHWAHSEDSDQIGRMPRLIWVFAGRTLIILVLTCCGSYSRYHTYYVNHNGMNATVRHVLLSFGRFNWNDPKETRFVILRILYMYSIFGLSECQVVLLNIVLVMQF